jgi:hypothetical protein
MELQICNFELSKELSELEFDITCDSTYMVQKTENTSYYIYAPTQALVCKWFRDVHNINIVVEYQDGNLPFTAIIYGMDNTKSYTVDCKTYEQAEEAGIWEAIKLIKNKEK